MPEMVPADDPPVAAEPVGGRSALERILFGPLPAALIIIEALAVETRRGVNQIAAAGCTTACHGVPTRLSFLKGATVILAVVAFVMVWRYWRQHLGPRRPAGTVALAALMFFTIAAAIAPWWGLATPLSLMCLLSRIGRPVCRARVGKSSHHHSASDIVRAPFGCDGSPVRR